MYIVEYVLTPVENYNSSHNIFKLFIFQVRELASRRSLENLTSCPVLTWTTEQFMAHVNNCLTVPGAELAFGGKPLENHTVPSCYGAVEPTAVIVPIEALSNPEHFKILTTELFGPFQILVRWSDGQLDDVLDALNNMQNHLTAGIVSNDPQFLNHVLGNTISGTIYAGLLARTTAAPQQSVLHFFSFFFLFFFFFFTFCQML